VAYRLFLRRDFTNPATDGAGGRAITAAVLPLPALLAVTVAVLTAAGTTTGAGIAQDRVQRSLATTFAHLYRLQTGQLHRPDVTEARLGATAACTRGGGRLAARGPGNDWRCVVSWHLPGVQGTGTATYQLDITADGRFVADGDGPKEVNGFFLVRTPAGDAPNPLWQFDGTVELLRTTSKG
jgi:ABC-2 type transport system permease protein